MWRDIIKQEDTRPSWEKEDFMPLNFAHVLVGDKDRPLASYVNNKERRLRDFETEVVEMGRSEFRRLTDRGEKLDVDVITITEEEGTEIVIAIYKGEILQDVVENCKKYLKDYLEKEIFSNLEQVEKGPIDKLLDDTVRPIVARFVGRILGVPFEDSTPIREGGILARGKLRVTNDITVNTIVYGDYLQSIKDAIHDDSGQKIANLPYSGTIRDKHLQSFNLYPRDFLDSEDERKVPHPIRNVPTSIREHVRQVGEEYRFDPDFINVKIEKTKLKEMSNKNLTDIIIEYMRSALESSRNMGPTKVMAQTIILVKALLSKEKIAETISSKTQLPRELYTYGGQLADIPGKNPEDIMEYLPEYTKRKLRIEDDRTTNIDNYKVMLGDEELYTMYFSLRFGIDRSKPIKIRGISETVSPRAYTRSSRYAELHNNRFIYGAKNPKGKEFLQVRNIDGFSNVSHSSIPNYIYEEVIGAVVGTADATPDYTLPVSLVGHLALENHIATAAPEDGVSWEYSDINERHFVKVEHSMPYPGTMTATGFLNAVLLDPNSEEIWMNIAESLRRDEMKVIKFKFYLDATGALKSEQEVRRTDIMYPALDELNTDDDTYGARYRTATYTGHAHLCIYSRINRRIHEEQGGEVCIIVRGSILGDNVSTFLLGQANLFAPLKGTYKDGSVSISADYITRQDIDNLVAVGSTGLFGSLRQLIPTIVRYGEKGDLRVVGNEGEQNVGENNKDTV
jgi:hypothetical protein